MFRISNRTRNRRIRNRKLKRTTRRTQPRIRAASLVSKGRRRTFKARRRTKSLRKRERESTKQFVALMAAVRTAAIFCANSGGLQGCREKLLALRSLDGPSNATESTLAGATNSLTRPSRMPYCLREPPSTWIVMWARRGRYRRTVHAADEMRSSPRPMFQSSSLASFLELWQGGPEERGVSHASAGCVSFFPFALTFGARFGHMMVPAIL